MDILKHHSDAVFWFLNDLGSRVVANSGIASDRLHAGKLILQSFKDDPDHISQIDGGTGEWQTSRSALKRSVRCANALRALGLKPNDVILITGPNHIDLTTPLYAAFYLGITVACMDPALGKKEQQDTFEICLPKLIFCQSEQEKNVREAMKNLNLDAQIVTFNKGQNNCDFSDFLEKYEKGTAVKEFQPTDFNPEDTVALLVATSGTTGAPKCAALTHKNLMIGWPYLWIMCSNFPTPIDMVLILSPVQWLSAVTHFVLSSICRYTRVQTSLPMTPDHIYKLINKFKPNFMVLSPTMMTTLLKPEEREKCDFSSFKILLLGGSAVQEILMETVKEVMPNVKVYRGYGLTEASTIVFNPINAAKGSCGSPLGHFQYRLVDPVTEQDIVEPNKPGELWIKGPTTFKGYYNNSEATTQIYTDDKWLKTGDIFYVDEQYNFFFVDRLKMLLKYRNHQISPTEIETTILKHPGVLDVVVTGIIDYECGELPVACVVPQDNYHLTAQDIKNLIKESLTDSKQLRGGVIFMKEFPLTSTSKVNRRKLKDMVQNMKTE